MRYEIAWASGLSTCLFEFYGLHCFAACKIVISPACRYKGYTLIKSWLEMILKCLNSCLFGDTIV